MELTAAELKANRIQELKDNAAAMIRKADDMMAEAEAMLKQADELEYGKQEVDIIKAIFG